MNQSLESRLARVRFSSLTPGVDRINYVNAEDVRIVLGRLPIEVWHRVRAVHFNDRSRGARTLGYVNRGLREIALCALPPRISLKAALAKGQTPEQFGAKRGQKWPALAVRRFMLYDVLLHELGHLQLIDGDASSKRLRFAREKFAQMFAAQWCIRLWSVRFPHPDPVHNPPKSVSVRVCPSDQHSLSRTRGRSRRQCLRIPILLFVYRETAVSGTGPLKSGHGKRLHRKRFVVPHAFTRQLNAEVPR